MLSGNREGQGFGVELIQAKSKADSLEIGHIEQGPPNGHITYLHNLEVLTQSKNPGQHNGYPEYFYPMQK